MRKRNGIRWGELIVGVLLLLLGVFTLLRPERILTGAVVIYGLIAVVLGVEDILVYMRLARFTGLRPVLSLITGILSVMCGVMLLANPDVGKWALTVLFPIWFLAHCISGLTNVRSVLLWLYADAEHSRAVSGLFDAAEPGSVLPDTAERGLSGGAVFDPVWRGAHRPGLPGRKR